MWLSYQLFNLLFIKIVFNKQSKLNATNDAIRNISGYIFLSLFFFTLIKINLFFYNHERLSPNLGQRLFINRCNNRYSFHNKISVSGLNFIRVKGDEVSLNNFPILKRILILKEFINCFCYI